MENLKTNYATALQTQILAVNLMNDHAKKILNHEKNTFTPFIGKSILKVDGTFKAKYEHEKISFAYKVNAYGFDFWVDTHYYFESRYGKANLNIIATVSGGGYDRNGVNVNHTQKRISVSFCDLGKDDSTLLGFSDSCTDYLNVIHNERDILFNSDLVQKKAEEYNKLVNLIPSEFIDALHIKRLGY